MARLTFGQLVTQGSLVGQNSAAPIWVARKLNAWLRKHYVAWAWPFLVKQATGVTVAAGAASVDVGNSVTNVAEQISRVFGPVYWRGSTYSQRGTAPVRNFVGGPVDFQEEMQDGTTGRGAPTLVKVQDKVSSAGLLYKTLLLFPVADQTYNLSFSYQEIPDDCEDSDVPQYPNEMTLLQAVKCAALEFDQSQDPMFREQSEILASMVADDRASYGANNSFGDVMQLDSSIFLP